MNSKIVQIVIVVVIAGGAGFFGGVQYGHKTVSPTDAARVLQDLTPEQRQQMGGRFGGTGVRGAGRQGAGGGFSTGEIIAKDDKSITIKMRDGGSKIVFVSASTAVMRSVGGSLNDLTIGEQVMANGSANSDGSVTAQSIQIRPASTTNQ